MKKVLKKKGSIKQELLKSIFFSVFSTAFIGYALFFQFYIEKEIEEDVQTSKIIGDLIGQDVVKIIYLNDIATASDVSTQLKSFENILNVTLHKKDGSVFFQYAKDNKPYKVSSVCQTTHLDTIKKEDNSITFCSKLFYNDRFIAYANYTFKLEGFQKIFFDTINTFLMILLFIFLLLYILSSYQASKFTAPILYLVKFLENIKNEQFLKNRITRQEENEFGVLYDEINIMLERMERAYYEVQIASVAFETQHGMLIADKERKVLKVNHSFEKITQYKEEEVIGKEISFLSPTQISDKFYQAIEKSLKTQDYFIGELDDYKKDGTRYDAQILIQTVLDDGGDIAYYVISLRDITKEKETNQKLEQLKYYSPLTGLMNRTLLEKELQEELEKKKEKVYGFIGINIEKFRMINEVYGFSIGNQLLAKIAKILQNNFKGHKIAQIGIDEFFLCFSYENTKDIYDVIEFEAQKIVQLFQKPFIIDNKELFVSIHMGITTQKTNELKDVKTILKEVVGAINIAKEQDKLLSFYDQSYQIKSMEHLDLYSQLKRAIKNGEFELFYQLQTNENKEFVGAEALMRWRKPDGEIVPPYKFIPLLENSGLILELSYWIVETACLQILKWQENEKTKNFTLSINACVKEFYSKNFIKNIQDNLQKYNVPKGLLKVELLESMLAGDIDFVLERMQSLRALGVKISLDDFGTGYSSLAYLKRLPINQIKIDQGFIKNITQDKHDRAIVKSILSLQDAFDVHIIAEGVETKEDYELLKEMGCYLYQGYYFAKPKPISEIEL